MKTDLEIQINEILAEKWKQFLLMQEYYVKISHARIDLLVLLDVMKTTDNTYCVNKLIGILETLKTE